MEQFLNQYSKEKYLAADFVAEVLKLDQSSLKVITNILKELNPSGNSLQVMFDLANQIAMKRKISIADVLNEIEVEQILNKDKISKKEKTSLIRKSLESLRYPEKQKILSDVSALVESIRRNHSVKVKLPQDLEGDTIELSFSIKSPENLESKTEDLLRLSKSPDIKRLFDHLLGRI